MMLHFCTATQQKWLVLLIVTKCITLVNVVFSTLFKVLQRQHTCTGMEKLGCRQIFLCCAVFFCYSFSPLSKKKVSQVINKLCFKSNNDSLSNTNESSFAALRSTFYSNLSTTNKPFILSLYTKNNNRLICSFYAHVLCKLNFAISNLFLFCCFLVGLLKNKTICHCMVTDCRITSVKRSQCLKITK